MFESLTPEARALVMASDLESRQLGHSGVGAEHLILGALTVHSSLASSILVASGLSLSLLRARLAQLVPPSELARHSLVLRASGKLALMNAVAPAIRSRDSVSAEDILLAALATEDPVLSAMLVGFDTSCEELAATLTRAMHAQDARAHPDGATHPEADSTDELDPVARGGGPGLLPKAAHRSLESFTQDLCEQARGGKLDPVVGRGAELARMITVLCRRTKNNPALLGLPGVGKTALVEGLAQMIVSGRVPPQLAAKRILSLDMGALLAGTTFRGDLEQRVKDLLEHARADPDVILFVDEMHTLITASSAQGASLVDLLKPPLARGELSMIGATTLEEYRRHVESDSALERRFAPVMVEPPSVADTLEILRRLRPALEAHHRASFPEETLRAAVSLAERYVADRQLPDKAIDVLDEAGARSALSRAKLPRTLAEPYRTRAGLGEKLREALAEENFASATSLVRERDELTERIRTTGAALAGENPALVLPHAETARPFVEFDPVGFDPLVDLALVAPADIAQLIAEWTGIPVTSLSEAEARSLLALEERLRTRVVGQEEALGVLASAVRRRRAGLGERTRPISFLFAGPSGVGKSESAKALAELVFGSEDALIQLDMGEFSESHTTSRLTGAPPGYVGHDRPGQLTERVRRRPHSVLLLDEVDKADPQVFDALLQLLEEGRLTDGTGRVVDCSHLVVILTCNLGARASRVAMSSPLGFSAPSAHLARAAVLREIKEQFRPEFLNRLDEVVVFDPLGPSALVRVVELLVEAVAARLEALGVSMVLTAEATSLLAAAGTDPLLGARPCRRAVRTQLEGLLTDALLTSQIGPGDTVLVDALPLAERSPERSLGLDVLSGARSSTPTEAPAPAPALRAEQR